MGYAFAAAGDHAGNPGGTAGGVDGDLRFRAGGVGDGNVGAVGVGEAGLLVDPPLVVEGLAVGIFAAGGVEGEGLFGFGGEFNGAVPGWPFTTSSGLWLAWAKSLMV